MMITDTPPQEKKVEVVGQEVEKLGRYGMFQFMGQWQSIADDQLPFLLLQNFKCDLIKSPRSPGLSCRLGSGQQQLDQHK